MSVTETAASCTPQPEPAGHAVTPVGGAALALLCAAQLMLILDVSVVNIALPSVQRDLGFSPSDLQWVVGGYALTFGGFLLLAGRAGDVYGRRRLFVVGLAVFALASLPEHLAKLDQASAIDLGFPHDFVESVAGQPSTFGECYAQIDDHRASRRGRPTASPSRVR